MPLERENPRMSSHPHIPLGLVEEGSRVLSICNACRYCEGFCAVFPAMERRTRFLAPDLTYLSNLCHDCGECYEACQYAPPHEFRLNLPRTMAEIRRATYQASAWPNALGGLITRHGASLLLSVVALPLLSFVILTVVLGRAPLFQAYSTTDGSFYQVVPHSAMVWIFGAAGVLTAVALMAGVVRFWRDSGGTVDVSPSSLSVRPEVGVWRAPHITFGAVRCVPQPRDHRAIRRKVRTNVSSAVWQAISNSLSVRYLAGGGPGCATRTGASSHARRNFHHLTFYGFMLCFAATSVAAFYHNVLGHVAPYPVFSVPVVLGSAGGLGLIVGPLGLLWLKRRGDSETDDRAQQGMDVTFLLVLAATSVTGFLLLVLRESAAMGTLLAIHLGVVLGLFVTMPYGKFVHGLYRFAALVRNALEERRG